MSDSNDKPQPITPKTHPELYAMFLLCTDNELFGFIQISAPNMIAGLRSPNLTAIEVPLDTVPPPEGSVWNGTEFVPPVE